MAEEKRFMRGGAEKYLPNKDHIDLYMLDPDFKGCPFCGEKPKTYVAVGGFVAQCENEECLQFSVLQRDVDELLKRWNRRIV